MNDHTIRRLNRPFKGPLAVQIGRLACRAVCAAPDEPKRAKQANLTPLLRILNPMIQLSYIHNGKRYFFAINIDQIVYFETAQNASDLTKSFVHLTTNSTLRVSESYQDIWAMIEAHRGDLSNEI